MTNKKKPNKKVIKDIKIINDLGLHARPASILVEKASQFESKIFILKEELRVNAKSIMGVLMLAASQGTVLTFVAEGSDAQEAIDDLEKLVKGSFYEKTQ